MRDRPLDGRRVERGPELEQASHTNQAVADLGRDALARTKAVGNGPVVGAAVLVEEDDEQLAPVLPSLAEERLDEAFSYFFSMARCSIAVAGVFSEAG